MIDFLDRGARGKWGQGGEPRPLLVLVADDEESGRTALCEVLRDGGYEAVGVADGADLLDRMAERRPAAIVLDLAMPRLNGMETAAAIRSDPASQGVPIIAITASWLAERSDLLAAAGFDAALRKPFGAERVLDELSRVLAAVAIEERAGVSGAQPHPW